MRNEICKNSNYNGTRNSAEKVYSPIVVKGEKEIEILGEYDHDKRAEKDKFQQEKWALGYGVTDNWFTEIYGEVEKEHIDPHFSFTALEWENRFQLAEQGKYFIDPGFIVEYEASFKDKTPSKMAFGPLFEKQVGSWVHTTNWIFTREVGPNQLKKMQGKVGWSTKYLLNPLFDPGFEYHADFGVMRKHNDYDAQSHQVGPNFYGKVGKMRYDVGYLFGISATAPHGAFKWIFEYEF